MSLEEAGSRFSRPAGLPTKDAKRKFTLRLCQSKGLRTISPNVLRPGGELGNRKERPSRKPPASKHKKKAGLRQPYSIPQLLSLRDHYKALPQGVKLMSGLFGEGLGLEFGREDTNTLLLPTQNMRRKLSTQKMLDVQKSMQQASAKNSPAKDSGPTTPSKDPSANTTEPTSTQKGPDQPMTPEDENRHTEEYLNKPLKKSTRGWNARREKTDLERFRGKCLVSLNKITVEKFDTLSTQLVEFLSKEANSEDRMDAVVSLLFMKTIMEHKFGELYARLCASMADELPIFEREHPDKDGRMVKTTINFKKILLNQCQSQFEKGHVPPVFTDKMDDGDREEARTRQKNNIIGTMIFIGELFKAELLPVKIIMICIRKLLEGNSSGGTTDSDLELLTRLLHTVGVKLDSEKQNKATLEKHYNKMKRLSEDKSFALRTRMLMQNLLESRRKGWSATRWEDKPKTKAEIAASHGRLPEDGDHGKDVLEEMRADEELDKLMFSGDKPAVVYARANRYGKVTALTLKEERAPVDPVPSPNERKAPLPTKYLLPTSAHTKEVSAQQEISQQSSQSGSGEGSPAKKSDGSRVIKIADPEALTSNLMEKLYEGEKLRNIQKTADKLKKYVDDYSLPVAPIVNKVLEKSVDGTDDDLFLADKLFCTCVENGSMTTENLREGFKKWSEYISSVWMDAPKLPEYLAMICKNLVNNGTLTMADMGEFIRKDPEMKMVRRRQTFDEGTRFIEKMLKAFKSPGKVSADKLKGMTKEQLSANGKADEAIKEYDLAEYF